MVFPNSGGNMSRAYDGYDFPALAEGDEEKEEDEVEGLATEIIPKKPKVLEEEEVEVEKEVVGADGFLDISEEDSIAETDIDPLKTYMREMGGIPLLKRHFLFLNFFVILYLIIHH